MDHPPSSPRRKPPTSRALLVSRLGASLFGSYAFVWGFVTLLITLQMHAGVGFGDARTLAYLLAFIAFLVAFLGSFAATSLVQLWAVLAGGGAVMTGVAWWLARGLA